MIGTLVLLTASFVSESPVASASEVTLPETVIVSSLTGRKTGLVWVCEGEWHDSQIGGQYRRCEYVKRGGEPKGF